MTPPKNQKIRKGIILVAGRGTRFLPATKSLPKEMLPILDKPVLQFIVEEMAESGITDILFVTSSQKRPIEDHFDRDINFESFLEAKGKKHTLEKLIKLTDGLHFFYTRQSQPLGNGHALLTAESFVGDEPFVVSDGDSIIDAPTPVTKQLINVFKKHQGRASIVGVQHIEDKNSMTFYGNVYGRKLDANTFKVSLFKEKPHVDEVSPLGLIIGGMRYVFTKDIWQYLKKQSEGRDGEIWLSDAANALAKNKQLLAVQYKGQYFDTGNKISMLKTIMHFAKKEGLDI